MVGHTIQETDIAHYIVPLFLDPPFVKELKLKGLRDGEISKLIGKCWNSMLD